jgi:DNA-binding NtrC family response regulator
VANILLVEDEALLRLILREALEDDGHVVREAMDASHAAAFLRDGWPVDLLLSDIRMPGLSGVELASRTLTSHPNVRIVLMTGYSAEDIPDWVGQSGIQVIKKPVPVDVLAAAVQTALCGA